MRWPAEADHSDELRDQHKPCPWPNLCLCTHVGCIAGWVDISDDRGERATPCQTCRPEVAERLTSGRGSLRQRRDSLREMARPTRTSPDRPW